MVGDDLKTIDVSLAQQLLLVYDQHCQRVLGQAWAEIARLKAEIAALKKAKEAEASFANGHIPALADKDSTR